jgi:hypothetical protein
MDNKSDVVVEQLTDVATKNCPSKFVLGLVAAIAGGYIYMLKNNITDLEANIQELEQNKTVLSKNLEAYEEAINVQHEALQKSKEAAIKADEKVQQLVEDLAVQKQQSNKKVQEILKSRKPKDCKESTLFLKDGIEDLQWKN